MNSTPSPPADQIPGFHASRNEALLVPSLPSSLRVTQVLVGPRLQTVRDGAPGRRPILRAELDGGQRPEPLPCRFSEVEQDPGQRLGGLRQPRVGDRSLLSVAFRVVLRRESRGDGVPRCASPLGEFGRGQVRPGRHERTREERHRDEVSRFASFDPAPPRTLDPEPFRSLRGGSFGVEQLESGQRDQFHGAQCPAAGLLACGPAGTERGRGRIGRALR